MRVPILPQQNSLAKQPEGEIPSWLLIISILLLPLGLLLPTMHIKKFVFLNEYHSILGFGVGSLLQGDVFLASIVLAFSVGFPAWKLVTLYQLCFLPKRQISVGQLKRLEMLGKWSMLDVLVIALIVFSVKGSGLATAFTLPGAYLFAISVLCAMLASGKIVEALAAQPSGK